MEQGELLRIRGRQEAAVSFRGPLEKEEEYLRLREALEREKRAFNERAKPIQNRLSELEEDLREEAKKRGVQELELVRFAPKMDRRIDPVKFVEFLMKIGRKDDFFRIAEIPIGRACGLFGEQQLEDEGVFIKSVDPYARCLPK